LGHRAATPVTQLREPVFWTPLQYQVKQDGREAGDRFLTWAKFERVELAPVLMRKIQRAF